MNVGRILCPVEPNPDIGRAHVQRICILKRVGMFVIPCQPGVRDADDRSELRHPHGVLARRQATVICKHLVTDLLRYHSLDTTVNNVGGRIARNELEFMQGKSLAR